jgi:sugar lactone lactonase YvrE
MMSALRAAARMPQAQPERLDVNPKRRNRLRFPRAYCQGEIVRRLLMVCTVAVSMFAAFSMAIAQKSSLGSASPTADQRGANINRAEIAPQGIESDKTVVIVASGIAPRALAVDPRTNIYLTNAGAPNRVFTLTGLADLAANAVSNPNPAASARLALVAGNGAAGSLGDGGSALAAQFDLKLDSLVMRSGISVASDGTAFVADTLNATIRRISGSDSSEPGVVRSIAGRWASSQSVALAEPLGMALDRAGNLYLADRAAGTVDVLPAATTSSAGDESLQVLAHIALPASITLTDDGNTVFVVSPEAGAVFEIDTQTRALRSLTEFPSRKAPPNDQTASTSTSSTQDGRGPVCPAGLAVDGGNNLFVADANSGSIWRLDAKTSQLTTAAKGLRSPGDMSFDSSGNLYVAEQGANRIVKFVSMGQDPSNLTITLPAALPPPPSPRVCPPGATGAFNFCDQPTGGATATQAFTLTNNTTAAISGIAISFIGTNPGDFQVSSSTCGTSLAGGASCAINVDFAPTATGLRSATLSVTDTTNVNDLATASVTGTGDDYQIVLNGSPMEQSVVQGGTLKFNFNITPDAVFGGDVTIVCPSNLPSLSTCTPSASTVTVTPGTPAQFSIAFKTTYNGVLGGFSTNGSVPAVMIHRDQNPPSGTIPITWLFATLLTSFVAVAFARRWLSPSTVARPLPATAVWIAVLLLACTIASLGGCKHHSVPANLNTPAGATNLTVQGAAQNAGRGITIILDVVAPG